MKIAFYAPLKAPGHPVPSGDRQMARLLMEALRRAGHEVHVTSTLRAFIPDPTEAAVAQLTADAEGEVLRVTSSWSRHGRPDLWFTYHPYYKAPDLIGPLLSQQYQIPYVTAEASYSKRRGTGLWSQLQDHVVEAVRFATFNICFTERDAKGLGLAVPQARIERLAPYIDTQPFQSYRIEDHPKRLVCVAMMRKGDKLDSYRMLAAALTQILDLDWRLDVIGDGDMKAEIHALFQSLGEGRVNWIGAVSPEAVPALLAEGGIYAWPGCGEAYGLAYLEAQAAGLSVAAQATAGVPEVVRDGETGLLTPEGDIPAYAKALRRLLTEKEKRQQMSACARRFVLEERSLDRAANRLKEMLPS